MNVLHIVIGVVADLRDVVVLSGAGGVVGLEHLARAASKAELGPRELALAFVGTRARETI